MIEVLVDAFVVAVAWIWTDPKMVFLVFVIYLIWFYDR